MYLRLGRNSGSAIRTSRYSLSPRTSRGRSPTTPMAWRMRKRFIGGRRLTTESPTSRARRRSVNPSYGLLINELGRESGIRTVWTVSMVTRREFGWIPHDGIDDGRGARTVIAATVDFSDRER